MALSLVATYHLAATGNNPSLLFSPSLMCGQQIPLVLIFVSCFLVGLAVLCISGLTGRAALHLTDFSWLII